MSDDVVDFLIRRGRVIDAASNFDKIADVAIKNGLIYSIGENLTSLRAKKVFDASQCLVTAGLVDLHVHAYQYCTPLGIDVDELCLKRGVTTVVDAGSAGASTLMGLRKFIAERSRTNMYAFLNISSLGLASAAIVGSGQAGGECDSLKNVNVDACVECIRENTDFVVGVKIRLTADSCNDGENEEESYMRSLEAADLVSMPLMVNHHFSTIPTRGDGNMISCPGNLKMGDIYTHCFHGFPGTIVDPRYKRVLPSVVDAQNRGVLFDVGHGKNSFSWTVGEICAKESFWPDIISTDLHKGSYESYENDLLNVMTKMLHLDMPLTYIIKAVTHTPAQAIGKNVGNLKLGYKADVVVMKLKDCNRLIPDSQSQIRLVRKAFSLKAVWKDGQQVEIRKANYGYQDKYFYEQAKDWPRLIAHDVCPPCPCFPESNDDEEIEILRTI